MSPRYFMNFGTSFFPLKSANGNSLVANVHAAATSMIIIALLTEGGMSFYLLLIAEKSLAGRKYSNRQNESG